MIIKLLGAFVATTSLSIIFQVPKKHIFYAGMVGTIGWAVYLLSLDLDINKVYANFIATFIVALTSHLLARILKAPVTMFLIPGVLPLVPGAGMYRIVSSIIGNNYSSATIYFYETLQMAGAIALGIFVIDTFFRGSSMKGLRIRGRIK